MDPHMDMDEFKPNEVLWTQEDILRYCPGGFHPVNLGDSFKDSRYVVRHKLGFSGLATEWLAKDNKENRWVALKIFAADIKNPAEIRNLQHLKENLDDQLSTKYIVEFLDTFLLEGPNGTHHCMVSELLGPSFESIQQFYAELDEHGCRREFKSSTTIRIAEQLVRAVKFVHDSGVCHGDISGANIAFSCKELWHVPEEALFEVIGSPQAVPLERCDGMPLNKGLPKALLECAHWNEYSGAEEDGIRLIEFGESFLHGEEPAVLNEPCHLRCPEIIIEGTFDYRVDLWRIGCFMYQLVIFEPPFSGWGDDYKYLTETDGFIDDLPIEWRPRLEELRLNSERKIQSLPATKDILGAADATPLVELPAPMEISAPTEVSTPIEGAPGLEELPPAGGNIAKFGITLRAHNFEEIFPLKVRDPFVTPFGSIIYYFMQFRPSDRLPLKTALRRIRTTKWMMDNGLSVALDPVIDVMEEEMGWSPHSDDEICSEAFDVMCCELSDETSSEASEETSSEASESSESLEEAQPETLQAVSDLSRNQEQRQPTAEDEVTATQLVEHQDQGEQLLSDSLPSSKELQPEATEGILNLVDCHEKQPRGLLIQVTSEQSQSRIQEEATKQLNSHEQQQPEMSDALLNTDKIQPDAQNGEPKPLDSDEKLQGALPETSKLVEQKELEEAAGTPSLVHGQEKVQLENQAAPSNAEKPQPDTQAGGSESLDSKKQEQTEESGSSQGLEQPQLETTKQSTTLLEEVEQQDKGRRKRLREYLGNVLNHRWRPWKRRREC